MTDNNGGDGDGNSNGTLSGLSAFQRDIIRYLAREGEDYGLGIKRHLESEYGHDVNHGRLYPNLDELVEAGLVEKRALDKRTNGYSLSTTGRVTVDKMAERWNDAADAMAAEGSDE